MKNISGVLFRLIVLIVLTSRLHAGGGGVVTPDLFLYLFHKCLLNKTRLS